MLRSSTASRTAPRAAMVLAILFLPALVSCLRTATPEEVVSNFYSTYVRHPVSGVPTSEQLERFVPFLSERLRGQLQAAAAYREGFIKQYPPEPPRGGLPGRAFKPPFVDGSYFTSLFEVPASFKVLRIIRIPDGQYHVAVRFWYGPDSDGWEDTAVVVQERRRFVIDNVLYSGAGPFNPPGRLSGRLAWLEQQTQ